METALLIITIGLWMRAASVIDKMMKGNEYD